MSRKPIPARSGESARLEAVFEKAHLLGGLFGEFDQNLVLIENRFGVYIKARGNKLQIEGEAEAIGRARDVRKPMTRSRSLTSAKVSNTSPGCNGR